MIVGYAADVLYVTDHRHFRVEYSNNVSGFRTWRYVTFADCNHGDVVSIDCFDMSQSPIVITVMLFRLIVSICRSRRL